MSRAAALCGLLLWASPWAGAAGAVLGQPLDFSVQLRLAMPETLTAQCVQVEVTAGEQRLLPSSVITRVEMLSEDRARVRVATAQAINEPVIEIDLSMGCTNRMLRRYVLFADPPGARPTSNAALALASPPLADAPSAIPAPELPRVMEPVLSANAGLSGPAPATTPAVPPPGPAVAAGNGSAGPGGDAAGTAPSSAAAATPAAPAPRTTSPPRAAPTRRAAAPPAAAGTAAPAPARAARPQAQAPRRPPPQRLARADAAAAAPSPAAPVSRLQMDLLEPGALDEAAIINEALNAVALAASAARAAAAAASDSAQRIAALEATVAQLRAESQARNDTGGQLLQQRLSRLDSANRWLLPLVLLVVVLAMLSAWLAWRMSFMHSRQQESWRQAARRGDDSRSGSSSGGGRHATAPIPFVTAELRGPAPGHSARAAPAWPPPATVADSQLPPASPQAPTSSVPEPAEDSRLFPRTVARPDPRPILPPSRPWDADGARVETSGTGLPPLLPVAPMEPDPHPTAPMFARVAAATTGAARDVTIEELIDLEQQAEFFVVLGQDEAAVELLVEHLRSTGGGSPLPYLKLLEIHQRLGDREAYDRTRARFNHRFNAYAPEWGVDMHGGRSLEDYPSVVPRLQQVWSRPLDAMAELEALLFRKSRGDLFDLPAYREVLFLYSLARDLLDREAADTGSVDLLLPLADGGQFSSTAPAPLTDLDHDTLHDGLHGPDFDMRPTAPVDFDISTIDRPASIFDTQPDTLHDTLVPVRRTPN